jgi:hypothetical protein
MINYSNVATTFTICSFVIALSIPAPSRAMDGSMDFSVDVSLSSPALAKLKGLKEKIIILVVWYGEPTNATRKRANEIGQIELGTEQLRLPASGGRVEITGRSVQVKHIDWVKDRAVQVNVNAFSARLSSPDNYLDCDVFEDTLVVARAKPVQMVCKLIGEH